MQRGQRVFLRDVRNPLSRLTLLFLEERPSRTEPRRLVVVVLIREWNREFVLWKEDTRC